MDQTLNSAAMKVALFCRLNRNRKPCRSLRHSELGILIFIATSKEPVCPLTISDFFGISKPSISFTLKNLIKNGYLECKPSEVDRRSYTLCVTPVGWKTVRGTCSEYTRQIDLLCSEMGKENFEKMIGLIETANRILKKDAENRR